MKILTPDESSALHALANGRGHLIFTSFKGIGTRILFLEDHLTRILKGADFLFPNEKWSGKKDLIKSYIEDRFSAYGPAAKKETYFRLNIFDEYLYLTLKDGQEAPFNVKLTAAFAVKSENQKPSYLKCANYLESDLEIARAKSLGFDDILYINQRSQILEASSSNIFIVKADDVIMTPPISSMVLDGVIRKNLITTLKNAGYSIVVQEFQKSDLLKAREIWLTNSIKGLRFVEQFEEKVFKESSCYTEVRNLFGRFGELCE